MTGTPVNVNHPRIAFIGDLTVDWYVRQNEMHLGGSSVTSAIWAKRLGARSSVVGAVGTDDAGKKYLKLLTRYGLSANYIRRMRGTTSSIEILTDLSGEKTFGKWDPGVLGRYHPRKRDWTFLSRQDAVGLVVYGKTVQLAHELAAFWRKSKTSDRPLRIVDFGDMTQFLGDSAFVENFMDAFDIFFFGLDKDSDEQLINVLRRMAVTYRKLIIVTLGKYGSVAFDPDCTVARIAQDVPVRDTTGAGDAYIAAFLVQYLQDADVSASLRAGTDLASRVIGHTGAY